MDTIRVTKQIIDFNKTVFNDNFGTRNALYEQTERLMNNLWRKSPILSEEGRKFTTEWMRTYKTSCECFKNTVTENFEKVKDFLDESI